MIRLLVFDTETTGLDVSKCGIIEIAFKIITLKATSFHDNFKRINSESPVKSFKMNPGNVEFSEQELAVNGYSKDQIKTFPALNIVQKEIRTHLACYVDPFSKDKIQRFVLCGHNVGFDIPFLLKLWEQAGDKYPWSFFQSGNLIDTLALFSAQQVIGKIPYTESRNLKTIAQTLGVTFNESLAHGVAYDCEITAQCLIKLLGLLE
jgi:DNA polymerase III epsilon subunit-like protein